MILSLKEYHVAKIAWNQSFKYSTMRGEEVAKEVRRRSFHVSST